MAGRKKTRRPWRIHVIRRAPLRQVVVMLCGPERTRASFLWDWDTDHFQLGQMLRNNWLRPDECDLSADGQWFSYHARTPSRRDPVSGDDYQVISRPPYLHAVFLDPGYSSVEKTPEYPTIPPGLQRAFCANIFSTLSREGWSKAEPESEARWHYSKPISRSWRLVRCMHHYEPGYRAKEGRSPSYYSHVLVRDDGFRIRQPDWEWADTDGSRLLWGSAGKLYRSERMSREGPLQARLVKDFQGLRFQRIRAPYDHRP